MNTASPLETVLRGIAITLVILFFMFPIFWIVLMSFQTNATILQVPPSIFFEPTLQNYQGLITGQLVTDTSSLEIKFMSNLFNSLFLSTASVAVAAHSPLTFVSNRRTNVGTLEQRITVTGTNLVYSTASGFQKPGS